MKVEQDRTWNDPVKSHPAKPETLAIEGDFEKFTSDMKRFFRPKEKGKPKPASPCPVPDASS